MRVALFTSQFPSRVNTFFARDVRGLLAAGVSIDVFPIYPLDESLWQWVPEILSESVFTRDHVHHSSAVRCLLALRPWPAKSVGRFLRDSLAVTRSASSYGIRPLAKSLYVLPLAWNWARRYGGQYEHVLAYWGNYSATCAWLANRLQSRPVPLSFFLHAGTDLYRDQVLLREKLLAANNVFVVCNFNREFIRKLYPDIFNDIASKIHIHHLGLDFKELEYVADCRAPNRVLAVGGFSKAKGFDVLLRAVKKMLDRNKEVELELIGDGPESRSLRCLASELGIMHRVAFRGWLTFEGVRTAMRTATLLVHPSIGLGDAVPTVIKEATALGLPVVASDIAGIPELLDGGRCGCLVPPGNVNLLVSAMEHLLTDTSLRRRYSLEARRYAERMFDLWVNGASLSKHLFSTQKVCDASGSIA